MDLPVSNLGGVGLNTDRAAVTLPPNVWTEIQNGRCDDGAIGPGITWLLWDGAVPNEEATWLLSSVRQDIPYLFVSGNTDVYLWDGSSYIQVNQTIPNTRDARHRPDIPRTELPGAGYAGA
jgi:hypothetical protein